MFTSLRRRFLEWRLARETSRRLLELDDHLLADVGFNREDASPGVLAVRIASDRK